jgi:hypothetical protein
MQKSGVAVLSAMLMGLLIGCSSKDSPTPAPNAAVPATDPLPNRDPPTGTTSGGTTPAPNGAARTDTKNKLKVEIAKAKISINGTVVAIPGQLAVLEKALGKPSGTADDPVHDKNKYVFWNGLGIRASQDKGGKQELRAIDFYFDPFWDLSAEVQSKTFTGELLLEGQAITKTTSRAELAQKVKIGQEYLGSWTIRYDETPLEVFITLEDKGTVSVTVSQPR